MEHEKNFSTLDHYIMIKTLGTGKLSKVKLAFSKKDEKYYAIKLLKKKHALSEKAIFNEFSIMKRLSHSRLVSLIDFQANGLYRKGGGEMKSCVYIVMELAEKGELFQYLFHTGRFSEESCRYFFKQLIEGLEYMHSQGVTHRDLKPENLLLDSNFNLKIADFGFSASLDRALTTRIGTDSYMAPEIQLNMPYNGVSADLFSAGVILFIMYTGCPPFSRAISSDPYFKLLCTNKHDLFFNTHLKNKPNKDFFSKSFKSLISAILAFDPTQRLSIGEIKAHPWWEEGGGRRREGGGEEEGDMRGEDEEVNRRREEEGRKMEENVREELEERRRKVELEEEVERRRKAVEKRRRRERGGLEGWKLEGGKGFRSLEESKMEEDAGGKEYLKEVGNDGKDKEEGVLEEGERREELRERKEKGRRKIKNYEKRGETKIFDVVGEEECELLEFLERFCKKQFNEVKSSENRFKIACKSISEEGEICEFLVKLSKIEENINMVEYSKINGPVMNYYTCVSKIREYIKKLYPSE